MALTEEISRKKELFLKYYTSARFESELVLPERPSFHHFRFELFSQKRVFRRIRDVVNNKRTLIDLIRKECPRNVFFTPVRWLDPVNVRRKKEKEIKDYMLSSPLYFDIDMKLIPGRNFDGVIQMTQELIGYIEETTGRKPDWIVFSGNQGFHVYYWNWDNIPQRYSSSTERINNFKQNRKKMLEELQQKAIQVDKSVTSDPWRLLRVPGTLHGKTGMIAKLFRDLKDFSFEKVRV
jgi:DNA primase catalytic subunit